MTLKIIEFILASCFVYGVITIGIPATIARANFNHHDLETKFALDETFDSIITMTNHPETLIDLTSQARKKQLQQIASDSTDIYLNRHKSIKLRYQELSLYKQRLLKLKSNKKNVRD